MAEHKSTEEDKKRCVVLFRYKKINETSLDRKAKYFPEDTPFVEIQVGWKGDDFSKQYETPNIQEVRGIIEVRVYDEMAVDIRQVPGDLLGDYSQAQDRCEGALKEAGYKIIQKG